mgnify:CR=1 FL=1
MLSANSTGGIFTLIWNLWSYVWSPWQSSWVSWPLRAYRLSTTTVVKSWQPLTIFVTRLDLTLCMPVEKVAQGWLICPCFRVLYQQFRNFPNVWHSVWRDQWHARWDLWCHRIQGRMGERWQVWRRKAHQRWHRVLMTTFIVWICISILLFILIKNFRNLAWLIVWKCWVLVNN